MNKINKDMEFLNAIFDGDIETVQKIIDIGIDVNLVDKESSLTPLMVAAQNGRIEIAKLLIKLGSDINSKDKMHNTAFILAAESNHIEMVELLLLNGSNINDCTLVGFTALTGAIIFNKILMVKKLFEYNADITISNGYGINASQIASNKGYNEIVDIIKTHESNVRLIQKC